LDVASFQHVIPSSNFNIEANKMGSTMEIVALSTINMRFLIHNLFILSLILSTSAWAPSPAGPKPPLRASAADGGGNESQSQSVTRRNIFASAISTISLASIISLSPSPAAAEDSVAPSIVACAAPLDGSAVNCVSTSSVRQLDLYMTPWTYADTMSSAEVLARLKGLIQSDSSLTLLGDGDLWVSASASRNLGTCTDQLDFVIRPDDHVIVFQSKQIQGPSASDFGANRKRLEDLRQKAGGIFGRMGERLDTADTSAREGVGGQLKAFWGLQSGMGYEDIVLE
jgi:uncharacterized protein (DUF1499 family)